MSWVKRVWNDPVLSKVIASAIMGVIFIIGSYFMGWLSLVTDFARSGVSYALSNSSVPNWFIGVSVLSLLLWLAVLFLGVWLLMSSQPQIQDWHSYKSDIFFGILWRWHYAYDDSISDLYSFCPSCDLQIHPVRKNVFSSPLTTYYCDRCNKVVRDIELLKEGVEDRVLREIHRKLRSGEWNISDQQ